MAGRRSLFALALLAAALHLAGIARAVLPAQDGLKFLRIAREFQLRPWADVVRGSDQHPLYPALVALAEPVVASIAGPGPDAWRIAAQGVAALAALALLGPLYALTRTLFDDRIARLALLIFIVLPFPAAIGHETLSDSLALFASLLALSLGEAALRSEGWKASLGCGIVAGLGYMARPEVLVVPVAVLVTWTCRWRIATVPRHAMARGSVLAVAFLVMVGSYALFKGEVSEKLALRQGAGLARQTTTIRKTRQWLPPGLNDPRWDFSPKEESEEPAETTMGPIVGQLFLHWAESLCGVFAVFAAWGVARDRYIRGLCTRTNHSGPSTGSASGLPAEGRGEAGSSTSRDEPGPAVGPDPQGTGRLLVAVYLGLFSLVLCRHALRMGYLSDRHTLMLVIASIPWAAAGAFVCARGLALALRWRGGFARSARVAAVVALVGAGVLLQAKPAHPSRWGHWAAGRWLAAHAAPSDAVLDTRGWAAFVSGLPGYDYWHVRQAFTDSHLAYIVVGTGELGAQSRRAETLRAVLAYAATPVVEFPERRDDFGGPGVRVYRYRRPESWGGLRP